MVTRERYSRVARYRADLYSSVGLFATLRAVVSQGAVLEISALLRRDCCDFSTGFTAAYYSRHVYKAMWALRPAAVGYIDPDHATGFWCWSVR